MEGNTHPLLSHTTHTQTDPNATQIDLHGLTGQCGDYKFDATPGTYIMLIITFILVLCVAVGTWLDYQTLLQKEYEQRVHDGYSRLAPEYDDEVSTAYGNAGAATQIITFVLAYV